MWMHHGSYDPRMVGSMLRTVGGVVIVDNTLERKGLVEGTVVGF